MKSGERCVHSLSKILIYRLFLEFQYELNEKKKKQDLINQKKRLEEQLEELAEDKERIEIWIRSDGTSAVCSNYKQLFEDETEGSKDELNSLSSVDVRYFQTNALFFN